MGVGRGVLLQTLSVLLTEVVRVVVSVLFMSLCGVVECLQN